MKKILFSLLAGATMLLGSCSKESVDNLAPSAAETTFTVNMAELQTRATSTVTPTRYIMEVWSLDGSTAENVIKKADGTLVSHLELSSGSFTALLDKTKAHTCLFWADGSVADNNNGVYNAASLNAVTLNTGKVATEAYYAMVVLPKGTKPAVAVTLKRAVAKVTLVETAAVEAGKNIVVTYPNNTVFNALDGAAGTPTTGYKTTITTAAGKLTGALGEFYMLSSAGGETVDMTIKYASEPIKSLTNVPLRQNYNTNIKGEFSSLLSKTFTVTADDTWGTPDIDISIWDGITTAQPADYDPNTSGTVKITSAAELAWLGKESGNTSFEGYTFILTTDINLNDHWWKPIGSDNQYFKGTFNGQNHTVSNLKCINSKRGGLFGRIADATVKDVTVSGSVISTSSIDGDAYELGGIAGSAKNSNISGCTNQCSVTLDLRVDSYNNSYVGGIVGYVSAREGDSALSDNTNTGSVSVTNQKVSFAGGITGYANVYYGRTVTLTSNTYNGGTPANVCIGLCEIYQGGTMTIDGQSATHKKPFPVPVE
ncbi:MAG: hypothetical protein PHC95_11015 [Parabacteroides sp.]|nr:hypothetical protein [Parabacteroides sp.]